MILSDSFGGFLIRNANLLSIQDDHYLIFKKKRSLPKQKKKKQTDKEEHHVPTEMTGVICLNRETERQRKTRARWTESKLNGLWWGSGWCCETWLKPPRHQQGVPGLQQGFTSTHVRFTENYIKENTEKHKAASWFWQQSTLLNHVYRIRSEPSHQFTCVMLNSCSAGFRHCYQTLQVFP